MKSFAILAFGLVALVTLSVAYPQVANKEDSIADEQALDGEGGQISH